MERLHRRTLGERGTRVVLCHGLFGQGRNWTTTAKALADDHRVTMLDMPNHGRSPWTEHLDYLEMADLVAAAIQDDGGSDDPVALVGHSMGGKIAMVLALRHPALVERLCVVDMSPVTYPDDFSESVGYGLAMHGLDLSRIAERADADEALRDAVPSASVRGFLLQNLRHVPGDARHDDGDGWRWQANLDLLAVEHAVLNAWPQQRLADTAPYDGPVLWVAGAESDYVTDEHAAAMDRWFPANRRVTVKRSGHWVHSEQPEVFTEILRRFVDGAQASARPGLSGGR